MKGFSDDCFILLPQESVYSFDQGYTFKSMIRRLHELCVDTFDMKPCVHTSAEALHLIPRELVFDTVQAVCPCDVEFCTQHGLVLKQPTKNIGQAHFDVAVKAFPPKRGQNADDRANAAVAREKAALMALVKKNFRVVFSLENPSFRGAYKLSPSDVEVFIRIHHETQKATAYLNGKEVAIDGFLGVKNPHRALMHWEVY